MKEIKHITAEEITNSVSKINSIYQQNASHDMFKDLVKLKKKISKKVRGHISFEYDPDKEEPLTVKVVKDA